MNGWKATMIRSLRVPGVEVRSKKIRVSVRCRRRFQDVRFTISTRGTAARAAGGFDGTGSKGCWWVWWSHVAVPCGKSLWASGVQRARRVAPQPPNGESIAKFQTWNFYTRCQLWSWLLCRLTWTAGCRHAGLLPSGSETSMIDAIKQDKIEGPKGSIRRTERFHQHATKNGKRNDATSAHKSRTISLKR
jgi:hypothetical protein